MRAEIISVGSEILQGEITDTDSAYLAGQLRLLGIDLDWISAVGDDLGRLAEVLGRAWQRSELILTTGGLGPTGDDLTREAIAEMLGEKLAVDPSLEKGLREWFTRLGVGAEMPLSNLKQAALIPSAQPLRNSQGTAPGWWVEENGHILVALPGPPRELEAMWQNEVEPRLRSMSQVIILAKTFKTSGLSEAALGELVAPLFSVTNPILGIYAKVDGIHLRFIAKAEDKERAEAMIAESEAHIRALLDKYIWGTDGDTMEAVAGSLLVERGLTLATMEDYSGGWLAASIADVMENATFFKGGMVAASDEAKVALGVDAGIIARYGAVSPEVAQEMAEAARRCLKADVGIGITGVGEAKSGQTGIVFIGIAHDKTGIITARPRTKRRVTTTALFELRKSFLAID